MDMEHVFKTARSAVKSFAFSPKGQLIRESWEDNFHDCFIKWAEGSFPIYGGAQGIGRYFITATVRRQINNIKSAYIHSKYVEAMTHIPAGWPPDSVPSEVAAILDLLSPEDQDLLKLYVVNEVPPSVLAKEHSITAAGLYTRVHRAKLRFKAALKRGAA